MKTTTATELVEEGVNGTVAASTAPDELARAIVRVHEGGSRLRESRAGWFHANAERLSLDHSLAAVTEAMAAADRTVLHVVPHLGGRRRDVR